MKRIYFRDVENILSAPTEQKMPCDDRYELRLKILRSVVDRDLTKKQKCYIMLYYRDNKTIGEIADLFGVLPSTVSRTITRARKKLYRSLTGRELYSRYTSIK